MAVGECLPVSEEMVALIGVCETDATPVPDDAVELRYDLVGQPMLHCRTLAQAVSCQPGGIVLIVARSACSRVFGRDFDEAVFHIPHELRPIALSILECDVEESARATYLAAKTIELLCESFRLLKAGLLVPMPADGAISLADARRLIEARRLIDERWNEKLTLDRIARACGLNRVKLTKGFREMFDCTIGDLMAERRLDEASRMLRTTDRPVSLIGYDSGYLNNASFARAFSRRFGMSPSDYRSARIAA